MKPWAFLKQHLYDLAHVIQEFLAVGTLGMRPWPARNISYKQTGFRVALDDYLKRSHRMHPFMML